MEMVYLTLYLWLVCLEKQLIVGTVIEVLYTGRMLKRSPWVTASQTRVTGFQQQLSLLLPLTHRIKIWLTLTFYHSVNKSGLSTWGQRAIVIMEGVKWRKIIMIIVLCGYLRGVIYWQKVQILAINQEKNLVEL